MEIHPQQMGLFTKPFDGENLSGLIVHIHMRANTTLVVALIYAHRVSVLIGVLRSLNGKIQKGFVNDSTPGVGVEIMVLIAGTKRVTIRKIYHPSVTLAGSRGEDNLSGLTAKICSQSPSRPVKNLPAFYPKLIEIAGIAPVLLHGVLHSVYHFGINVGRRSMVKINHIAS